MKIKLRMTLVIAYLFSLSLSNVLLADTSVATVRKTESGKSSVGNRIPQKEPVITNEAEYADFVKKREGFNQASSIKFVVKQTSKSSSASVVSKTSSFSSADKP